MNAYCLITDDYPFYGTFSMKLLVPSKHVDTTSSRWGVKLTD